MKHCLYWHIGPHKTGTTSLQRCIAANLDEVLESGLVPAPGFDQEAGNHHALARSVLEGRSLPKLPAADCFISSEVFYHLFYRDQIDPGLLAGIRQSHEIKIIFAVRRQDFLKESVYAEIATSWFKGPIEKERHFGYRLNWFVHRLEKLFGRRGVELVLMRDDREDDLVNRIIGAMGIDHELPNQPGRQRMSLHRRLVMALSGMEKNPRGWFVRSRDRIVEANVIQSDPIKPLSSPKFRAAFLNPFLKGNEAMASRYDLDGDYLTALPNDDWYPPSPLSPQEQSEVDAIVAAAKGG